MLGILVAVVIGLVIAFVYTLVSKKDGYNKSFIIGLALLPAIVASVILLVGSNVARAFSMAGAFALVRFRSAPGSAKDISVVFFAMATGLACGLGFVTFAGCFAGTYQAKVRDYGKDSVLLEFVHTAHKNTAIIQFLRSEFNSIEVVRGGSVGIEAITMPKR